MNYKQLQIKMNSFLLLLLVLIFYLKSSQSMRVVPVNLKLSDMDCQDIFGTADLKKIPPFEFVRIIHIDTPNSDKNIKFLVSKELIDLKLQKSTLFERKTPIWLASTNGTGVIYSRVPTDTLDNALDFYEDPHNKAGISIKKDSEGNLELSGYFRNSWIFRKLPPRLHKIWSQNLSESEHHRETRSSKFYDFIDNHIVIRRSISNEVSVESKKILGLQKKNMQTLNSYPFQLYFRTLIFVNYKELHTLYKNALFYELLIYLVSFWHAVNMQFNDFRNPSIQLHIAGIVIRNQTAPYLEDFMWIDPKNEYSEQSMNEFRQFVKEYDPMPGKWEIAVSQSDHILNSHRRIAGLAYYGTTCPINRHSSFLSLALITDKRDFSGIEIAVHEIGHLLGADHDGRNGSMCNDDGFIMSPELHKPEYLSSSWSICSQMEIIRRLRYRADVCWDGIPSIDKDDQIPKLLPGHITGLHDQCILRGFDYACEDARTTCKSLFCWSENRVPLLGKIFEKCRDTGPPLPGTYCGEYMHCVNQICASQTIV